MPNFNLDETGPLAAMFAAQAGATFGEGQTVPLPSLSRIREGTALVGRGEGGLSCISCHDFRGEHAVGDIRGPDMVQMHDRIRTDWLKRWLRDPGRYVEGTAMPAFFDGVTVAEREEKISRIVDAISAGTAMPTPDGLGGDGSSYLLQVTDHPVVFRGFVRDSSPRSIAVGLPGLLSYCFDADAGALRFAWAGAFLNANPEAICASWRIPHPLRPMKRGGMKFLGAIPDVFASLSNVKPFRLLQIESALLRLEAARATSNPKSHVSSYEQPAYWHQSGIRPSR